MVKSLRQISNLSCSFYTHGILICKPLHNAVFLFMLLSNILWKRKRKLLCQQLFSLCNVIINFYDFCKGLLLQIYSSCHIHSKTVISFNAYIFFFLSVKALMWTLIKSFIFGQHLFFISCK